jgi:cytochrome c556
MIALLVTLALGQSPCGDSAALIASAEERAAVFDLRGAMTGLAADLSTCHETSVPYWYLHGLIAAREAYRYGGSLESLEPVRVAIAQLAARSQETAAAEIARVVLLAASSAAQSERDEMGLFLDHALDLERQQRSAGLPGAPIVTAHEIAGDLWLQVHRFEDARRAYLDAATRIGATRRVTLGLARTAARLGDPQTSCEQYRGLVSGWPQRRGAPPELIEARTFLRRSECRAKAAR